MQFNNNNKNTMSDWKQIKDLKIGADIYDELYNKIIEDDEEQD